MKLLVIGEINSKSKKSPFLTGFKFTHSQNAFTEVVRRQLILRLLRIGCEGSAPIGQHPLPVRVIKRGKPSKVSPRISSGVCKRQKQNQRQVVSVMTWPLHSAAMDRTFKVIFPFNQRLSCFFLAPTAQITSSSFRVPVPRCLTFLPPLSISQRF